MTKQKVAPIARFIMLVAPGYSMRNCRGMSAGLLPQPACVNTRTDPFTKLFLLEFLGNGAVGGDGQTINISSRNRHHVAQSGWNIRLVKSIVSPGNDGPVVF